MAPVLFLLVAATVFCTSVLSGIFGMAGGLVLLAGLLVILPVTGAIAVHGAIQIVANGSRAFFSRRYIDWRVLGTICIGLGLAALVLFILRYRPALVTVCFAIGLMPLLVWMPKSWLALDARKPLHGVLCGAVAGGLSLAVGVSGPTVDIFFIRTQMDRRAIIATKAASQVVSHAAKVVFYGTTTTAMTGGDWLIVAVAAPFAIIGSNVGYRILQKLTDDGFRAWTRWIVTLVGLFYLGYGIFLLLAPA